MACRRIGRFISFDAVMTLYIQVSALTSRGVFNSIVWAVGLNISGGVDRNALCISSPDIAAHPQASGR
jgi:phage tail protein X